MTSLQKIVIVLGDKNSILLHKFAKPAVTKIFDIILHLEGVHIEIIRKSLLRGDVSSPSGAAKEDKVVEIENLIWSYFWAGGLTDDLLMGYVRTDVEDEILF